MATNKVDLHGLHVDEALQVLAELISQREKGLSLSAACRSLELKFLSQLWCGKFLWLDQMVFFFSFHEE